MRFRRTAYWRMEALVKISRTARQIGDAAVTPYLERFRDALDGRSVLVTGAGGLIGSALCRMLVGLGARVTGSGRSGSQPASVGSIHRWIATDLTRQDDVQALMAAAAPDFVFNLAGSVRGERSQAAIAPTIAGNLVATVNLLMAAQAAGVTRFVNTGSLTEPTGAEEAPSSPYAASKWAANAYVRMYGDLFDLETAIVRLFMVYGPGQNDGTKLVPYVTRRFLSGVAPRLTSGVYEADWIYIDDVVEGVVAAACVPAANGMTIELGTGRLTSVREVAEQIKEILGTPIEPEFGAVPERPREVYRVAELGPSKEILDWQPRTSLPEGLRKTVSSLRAGFRKVFDGAMTVGTFLVSIGGLA